jgi:hypothetical protein
VRLTQPDGGRTAAAQGEGEGEGEAGASQSEGQSEVRPHLLSEEGLSEDEEEEEEEEALSACLSLSVRLSD